MRRPIGWIDEEWEGGEREVRVTFHANQIKWQFLPKGSPEWDYASVPTEANWEQLIGQLKRLIQRGHLFQQELKLAERRIYTPPRPFKSQQDYSQQ